MTLLNPITMGLRPYPMEELARARADLRRRGVRVFDFGAGDPEVPTWEPIRAALANAVPMISHYPSVRGTDALHAAHEGYLGRRFGLTPNADWSVIPSAGSKEAVFHTALSVIGRAGGRRRLVYPDPGYPVYRASAIFAGGIPHPVALSSSNGYLLEPWDMPAEVVRDTAALWLNYPHNPTGATAPRDYWRRVIEWCHQHDVILLSDDCYIDIYDASLDATPERRPICPLEISTDRVVSLMSLSKRSGLTGYRSGLIAGDRRVIDGLLRARANFGVGSPEFVPAPAVVAWNDDEHVAERRRLFTHRVNLATAAFRGIDLLDRAPEATFYLWCQVPERYAGDDVAFARALMSRGVLASPSQWLSEGIAGHIRFALVPTDDDFRDALPNIASCC